MFKTKGLGGGGQRFFNNVNKTAEMVPRGNPKPNIFLMPLCIIFKTFTQVLSK